MSLALANFFELPPPHPILVNFTAALVPLSLLCDAAGRIFRRSSLRDAGWWMIAFAGIVTPFTALTGWIWMRQNNQPATSYMTTHQWLGVTLAPIIVAFALWRCWMQVRKTNPSWRYLGVLFIIVAALVMQGHLGGLMAFGGEPTVDEPATGGSGGSGASGGSGGSGASGASGGPGASERGGSGATTTATAPATEPAPKDGRKEDRPWQQSIDLSGGH